ncbi:hypothetical protein OUZ56_029643 [Daphnia magna]|uniref:Uncharacterized protein n=1 Tax=Daphnia magna TaxID=35525 RepID=A0ABR0B7E6_9CRUS|nr:hypothetical protein OUZ56_029643 [Daphnia magna]
MERMHLERVRYQSTSTLASTSASESTSCYRQIIKYIAHLWRRSKRRIPRRYRDYRSRKKLQQQQQQLDHPQYGKQQSATHLLSLRTRRKKQRRRKRRRRWSRYPHPECPTNGTQQQEQQQQHQLQKNSQCSSSYRVPSVALRINDGRLRLSIRPSPYSQMIGAPALPSPLTITINDPLHSSLMKH